MSFRIGSALDVVGGGGHVARKGWNGKDLRIGLYVPMPPCADDDEYEVMTEYFLYLEYPPDENGRRKRIPWAASQSDILADDWYEVE